MNQRRLNAYLKIIQELLTCPKGEEWIRLKQHEDWVDAELVQIMEQVASQLLQEGNQQAATFLHNWAAKLHHILVKETVTSDPKEDKSRPYLSFIQALLDAPEEEKETLLTENRDLIGPGLVQTMKQVARQLQEQGADAPATYLSNLATELNQAWIEAHEFQPKLDKVADGAEEPQTAAPSGLQQQLADAMHEMTQALHQLNQTLTHQPRPANPLWYMDVLERAATAQWLLTTEEIEQLIGVKPKCHGKDSTYQRGTWTFVKTGKLGAQTAWRVTKTCLDSLTLDSFDREPLIHTVQENVKDREVNVSEPTTSIESLAKHPPLRQEVLNNGADKHQDAFEIPEMDDVWA